MLQPLIENAIYHGFDNSEDLHDRIVTIRCVDEGETIVFTVEDNGRGMDEETVSRVRGEMDKELPGDDNVGLANIHRRLKLYFGEEYGIRVTSAYGCGTTVSIVFPETSCVACIRLLLYPVKSFYTI